MVKTYLSTLWIFKASTKNPRVRWSTCRTISFPRGVGIMDVPFSSSPSLVTQAFLVKTNNKIKKSEQDHAHDKDIHDGWWSLDEWSLDNDHLMNDHLMMMMMMMMMIMMTIGCSCRMSNISSIDPPTCNLKWTLLGPLRPSLRQLSKMPHWALCTGWFLLIGGGTIIRYIDEKTFF